MKKGLSIIHNQRNLGFTLAEVLICLVILGEIATFTIPKLIVSQQNYSYNAKAKETIAMVVGAYQTYQMNNTPSASTTFGDLTPYINYLATDTATNIDAHYTSTTFSCGGSNTCLLLHNGGRLIYVKTWPFGGTSTTHALQVWFDPDGVVTDGTTNGPGKSLAIDLMYNGRVSNYGASGNVYCSGAACPDNAVPGRDPPWFTW